MFINSAATQVYDYRQTPYIERIDVNYSSDATYNSFNDVFESLAISLKKPSAKEEIFDMYGECVYFSAEENEKLMNSIRKNKVEKKLNIFEYYD